MARAFISVGSNVNPERNVPAALRLLSRGVRTMRISTFYATEPLGHPEQPTFYNGVVEVETDFPPHDLKHGLLRCIEDQLGRQRGDDRYAPRTIDLDVLLYDDVVADDEDLRLPDPHIFERPFLATALRELCPDLVLPGSEQRIADVAARLDQSGMQPLPEFTRLLRKEASNGYCEG
ncbi:MAG: 2-amino-4-hydroxy-6-hydroxymethyldihydropteridine diphosphokinase [Armatimonadota bacterium]